MSKHVARWISIIGHPFVLVAIAIFTATRGAAGRTQGTVLGAVFASMLAIAAYVFVRHRRGELTDVDVSSREQRPRVFLVGVLASLGALVAMIATGQSELAVRGAGIAAILLVVLAVANRWLKVSLHTVFALVAAAIAWRANSTVGGLLAVMALSVAWSRVAYGRHRPPEVFAGIFFGVVAGYAYLA